MTLYETQVYSRPRFLVWPLCDTPRHSQPEEVVVEWGRMHGIGIGGGGHGYLDARGVLLSNSRSRAVMEAKIDSLTSKVEQRNQVLERTYKLEQDMAVASNDIEPSIGRQKGDDRVSDEQRVAVAPGAHDCAGRDRRVHREHRRDPGLRGARPDRARHLRGAVHGRGA